MFYCMSDRDNFAPSVTNAGTVRKKKARPESRAVYVLPKGIEPLPAEPESAILSVKLRERDRKYTLFFDYICTYIHF